MVKMTDLPGKLYQIDSDIPIPTEGGRGRHEDVYATARQMKVGQSFLMPKERSGITGNLARATGFKFTQRTEGDYMRIWRTE